MRYLIGIFFLTMIIFSSEECLASEVKKFDATVSYADYDITNKDTYNVEVEIRDAYSVLMLKNGECINSTGILKEGTYTFELPTEEGTNKIDIVAMDKAGNISSYTSVVERIIPVEKPIPWLKIIIGCVATVMISWYIYDVIKKYRYGDEEKNRKNKSKAVGEKHNSEYSQVKRRNTAIKEILNLVIPLVVIYIILTYIIGITVIQSASMEPTLMIGSTVFVKRLSYKAGREVQRGDVVMFNSKEYNKILGKRIIGLPGDTIEFKSGYVVLNGQYCDESAYLAEDIETNSPKTFAVPEGCYFLLGDNRKYSSDARFWQEPYIRKEDIMGIVWYNIYIYTITNLYLSI